MNETLRNTLFPFHLVTDDTGTIVSHGTSLGKMLPQLIGCSLNEYFSGSRVDIGSASLAQPTQLVGKAVTLYCLPHPSVSFSGHVDAEGGQVVFFISPRFVDLDSFHAFQLSVNDLAAHDSQLEYLFQYNNFQRTEEELREKLNVIREHREQLKKTTEQLHSIASFPLEHPDPLLRIDMNGVPIMQNTSAEKLEYIIYQEKYFEAVDFWKAMAYDFNRFGHEVFEAEVPGKLYEWRLHHLPGSNFINISTREITEEKRAKDALLLQSAIAQTNLNAILITNAQGEVTWANDTFLQLTGYTLEECKGKTPVDLCAGPLSAGEQMDDMVRNFFQHEAFDVVLVHYRKDRSTFWARTKGQPVKDHDGHVKHYFAMIEDVTELREKGLRLDLLSRIAADNQNAITIADKEGNLIWVNESFKKLFHYTLEEVMGKSPAELLHGIGNEKKTVRMIYRSIAQGKSFETEILNYTKEKEPIWLSIKGQAIKDERGEVVYSFALIENITERRNKLEAARMKEEKYRGIISNMSLGLLEVDVKERIIFANQSFSHMSGYSIDELMGLNARELFIHPEQQKLLEKKISLREQGISDAYEVPVQNKKGEAKWWLISGAPRYDEHGKVIGSIGIHLDITKQKQLEAELKEAKEIAEENARSKELFLANMSHEIRTPMNGIVGMVRQLERSGLNKDQKFYTETISSAASNLLVILNDILDLSRIEAGKLSLEKIGFHLKETIERSMAVLTPRAQEKKLEMSMHWDDTIAAVLIGDPYRINQVLLNLLGNSIKFTEKGGVHIILRQISHEADVQTISISVVDSGIGMYEDFLSKLFTNFSQEENSTSRKYGGTGLGMSITKQLVELMDGKIHVSSKKKIGTTIRLELPLLVGTERDLPKQNSPLHDISLKGLRVLVVEDNELNRLVVSTSLKNEGCIITEATNGLQAVELMVESWFDIVLMDLQMPVLDGIKATKFIRTELKSEVPIVALTANAVKGEREKCIEAGMNDYLSKPFEEEDLFHIIQQHVGDKLVRFVRSKPKVIVPEEKSQLYSLRKLREISQGDEGFIQKMLAMFIDSAAKDVAQIESAYTSADYTTMRKVAHRLKPTLDNMGIQSLHTTIRAIEGMQETADQIAITKSHVETLNDIVTAVCKDLSLLLEKEKK